MSNGPTIDASARRAEWDRRLELLLSQDTDLKTVIKIYDDCSPEYEEAMTNFLQNRKHVAVDELDSLLGDNKDALILDLGAGTGIQGKILYDRGYKNLVALEPSQGMIKEAKKKNIYGMFIKELMTDKPTSIEAGGYIVFLNLRTSGEELEDAMETLVAKGAWRMLNRKLVPDYVADVEGILFTLQKSL